MSSRHVTPDVVCYGAAISALSEVAATQNTSAWGGKSDRDRGRGSDEGVNDGNAAGDARRGDIAATRPHEKAVALIGQMRRDGPR